MSSSQFQCHRDVINDTKVRIGGGGERRLYRRANHRQHRVLGCRPADRIEADRAAMLALPPVPPSLGWRNSSRLPA
jgi:hypothetical protein